MSEQPGYDAFAPFRGPDFVLDRPEGWVVEEDDHGRITVEGSAEGGAARLAIWPVMVNESFQGRPVRLLQALAGELRGETTWTDVVPVAQHVWSARGEGPEAGFARLVLGAPTPQGQPVWLYLATAPEARQLSALKPLAERVFRSYRPVPPEEAATPTGPPPDPGAAAAGTTRYTEPTEGAFDVAVPEGWQFQAGVVRHGPFGYPWFRLRAGDGSEIRYGDPRVPTSYLEPSPVTEFMGRPVGSVQGGVMVRPYVPPVAFAAEYAGWMVQELGRGGIEVSRELADEQALAAMTPPLRECLETDFRSDMERQGRLMSHVQTRPTFGRVDFTSVGEGDLAGSFYVFGTRSQAPNPAGGGTMQTWNAVPFGILGPSSRREELEQTLHEVGASRRRNPQWEQRQEQAFLQQMQHDQRQAARQMAEIRAQGHRAAMRSAAERSRILADTYSEISDITHQGFLDRQRSGDEMQRRTVNAIHEQVDVFNPSTGQVTRGVPGHANHYFVDSFGNTVGTELDHNPDPFRFTRGQNLDDLYDSGGS